MSTKEKAGQGNGYVMVRRGFLEHRKDMSPWAYNAFLFLLMQASSRDGRVRATGRTIAEHFDFKGILGLTDKDSTDKGGDILNWLLAKGYLRIVVQPRSSRKARTFEIANFLLTTGENAGKYTRSRAENEKEYTENTAQETVQNGDENAPIRRRSDADQTPITYRSDAEDDPEEDPEDDEDVSVSINSTYYDNDEDDPEDNTEDNPEDAPKTHRSDTDVTPITPRTIQYKDKYRDKEEELHSKAETRSASELPPAAAPNRKAKRNTDPLLQGLKINNRRWDQKEPGTAVASVQPKPETPAARVNVSTTSENLAAAERLLETFKEVQPDNWNLIQDKYRDSNLEKIAKGLSEKVREKDLEAAIRWVFSPDGAGNLPEGEIRWPVSFIMREPEKLIHQHRAWIKRTNAEGTTSGDSGSFNHEELEAKLAELRRRGLGRSS